ncbi:mitochondrial 37S ribosomal protein rsm10 [Dinochytrium kinnereticum]|nr:mitochondrial 37S ribosomal protein rsm10 [Dinochytrium kinnereticum]
MEKVSGRPAVALHLADTPIIRSPDRLYSGMPSGPLNDTTFDVDGGRSIEIPVLPAPTSQKTKLVANIELQGFMPDHLDFVGYFVRYSAHARNLATSDAVIHMPTKTLKWHVTRGPFVHDKSKEIFEQKTYRRLVQLFDAGPEKVQDFVTYVNSQLPSGIDLVVERFDWSGVNGLRDALESQVKAEEAAAEQNRLLTQGVEAGTADTAAASEGLGRKLGKRLTYSEDIRNRAAEFIKKSSKGPEKKK